MILKIICQGCGFSMWKYSMEALLAVRVSCKDLMSRMLPWLIHLHFRRIFARGASALICIFVSKFSKTSQFLSSNGTTKTEKDFFFFFLSQMMTSYSGVISFQKFLLSPSFSTFDSGRLARVSYFVMFSRHLLLAGQGNSLNVSNLADCVPLCP